MALLRAFVNDFAMTVVLVTHDQSIADFCDKQHVLHHGMLVDSE